MNILIPTELAIVRIKKIKIRSLLRVAQFAKYIATRLQVCNFTIYV